MRETPFSHFVPNHLLKIVLPFSITLSPETLNCGFLYIAYRSFLNHLVKNGFTNLFCHFYDSTCVSSFSYYCVDSFVTLIENISVPIRRLVRYLNKVTTQHFIDTDFIVGFLPITYYFDWSTWKENQYSENVKDKY